VTFSKKMQGAGKIILHYAFYVVTSQVYLFCRFLPQHRFQAQRGTSAFPCSVRLKHTDRSQGYRNFNTWMGDPLRALELEVILNEIEGKHLVENTAITGKYLLAGLEELQVLYL